jgi:putative redox protein
MDRTEEATMTVEMLKPGEVLVETGEGKFGTVVRTDAHSLIADEPRAVGGLDAGLGPYDLLLASLGTCTSMTLRLYAAREAIPLEGIAIRLSHDRNHERDCEDVDRPAARLEAIFRTITLEGPLTDAQRARLLEIADKCPVHRTLTGALHVHTRAG